ncbi:hypothetical protein [Candidatus Binatus sp.]|uniref:hypothetical protein n=1 Tax=Candidatus Binatus sp. TaxID=2811406 RepID=UPI003BC20211
MDSKGDRSFSEAESAVLQLLRDDYPKAREAVIELEVYSRTRSKKAVYEMRDFLDHLHRMLMETDPEKVRGHIFEARTHIRRCVVEPMEYLAEKQFVKADRLYRWRILIFGIPFTGSVPQPAGIGPKLIEAQRLIAKGRAAKTSLDAYGDFKQSFQMTTDLCAPANPLRLGLGVITLILAAVAATLTITRALH